MSIAAVAAQRPLVVSLIGDPAAAQPLRDLLSPVLADAVAIFARARTAAERNLLAARIDAAVANAPRAVMLVAEGSGCLAAAWWARLSPQSYVDKVAGAVMIAPGAGHALPDAFASPRARLPFPSIVLDDGAEARDFAREWGGRLVDGPRLIDGHSTPGRFAALLERFTAGIVERDLRAADALMAGRITW